MNQTEAEPRTAAGRALVEDEPRLVTGEHSMLARVLAIEAEAAALTEGKPAPLDVGLMAEAVRRTALDHYRPEASASYAGRLAKHYARLAAGDKAHPDGVRGGSDR